MKPVRLEPAALRSRVKHSTTELPIKEDISWFSKTRVKIFDHLVTKYSKVFIFSIATAKLLFEIFIETDFQKLT